MNLSAYHDRYMPLLEAELRDALSASNALRPYYEMMHYHMGWVDDQFKPIPASQGKRMRPTLCLLTCEAVGGRVEHAVLAAAAIELLHNFSLIHDDIEDNSDTRRHRTTLWKLWGLAHGINCGDGMFAIAFLTLTLLPDRGVSANLAMHAQRVFAETCLALTEGQYMDMTFETQPDVSLDDYLIMIRNKTAALIACAARLGALLGGGEPESVNAFARFGESLGMAFQVIDDILGIWGSEQETGKSVSSDILTRKKTLPIVYAWDEPELQTLYGQESLGEKDVGRVLAILEAYGARGFAEQLARQYSEQALHYLDLAGDATQARQAMRDYALLLLDRNS
jgi:geranylgeranyl diphosphate synthase type I